MSKLTSIVILFLSVLLHASTSPDQGADISAASSPNLLVVLLGSAPASMLLTGENHAMSSKNAPYYAANFRLLQQNSMTFTRAYVNIARSSPSRISILTSLNPRKQIQIMGDAPPGSSAAFQNDQTTTLSSYVKNTGAVSAGVGRIFMNPGQTIALASFDQYAIPKLGDQDNFCEAGWTCVVSDESTLTDSDVADRAVTYLRSFAANQKKFSLLVGFHRIYSDKSYPQWASNQLSSSTAFINSQLQPSSSTLLNGKLFTLNTNPSPFTSAQTTQLKATAFATLQWIDFCLGRLLDEIRGLRFWDNTIIIISSESAQSLGEFSDVSPDGSSVFEHTTRVPLIIRDPRSPNSFGQVSNARVELVDLATTAYDMVGLNKPRGKLPLQGLSLKPLLDIYQTNPVSSKNFYADVSLRFASFSETARCTASTTPFFSLPAGSPLPTDSAWTDCASHLTRVDAIGISMRTSTYRYTEWRLTQPNTMKPIWETEGLIGRELYSHVTDTGFQATADGNTFELANIAPCSAADCAIYVPPTPKPTSSNPAVPLPNDPKSNDFYTAPSVPAGPLGALVRNFALMMRSASRDGIFLCSNHGLFDAVNGNCISCDPGWTGNDCSISTYPIIGGADITSTPGTSSPSSKPPVGAPTYPPSTPAPTPSQNPPLPTARPNSAPQGQITCSSISYQATCQNINGCQWQGAKGCSVPLPAPCGCSTNLSPVKAYTIDGASGESNMGMYRNECHATCKGAIIATEAPGGTPSPTRSVTAKVTRSPNTPPTGVTKSPQRSPTLPTKSPIHSPTSPPSTASPAATLSPGSMPFPREPGVGAAQPVPSLTLYLIIDNSINIGMANPYCYSARNYACTKLEALFYDQLVIKLAQYVSEGFTKLRVGLWTYSCDENQQPVFINLFLPITDDQAQKLHAVLLGNMGLNPKGGRCASKVFDQILQLDQNERNLSPRRSLIYMQSGTMHPLDLPIVREKALQLRQAGVATFAIVVARGITAAGPSQDFVGTKAEALTIVGAAERVFLASSRYGVIALNAMINVVAAGILVTMNQLNRIQAGEDTPDSFFTYEGIDPVDEDNSPLIGGVIGAASGILVTIGSAILYRRHRQKRNSSASTENKPTDLSIFLGNTAEGRTTPSKSKGSPKESVSIITVSIPKDEVEDENIPEYEVARASPVKTARRRSIDRTTLTISTTDYTMV